MLEYLLYPAYILPPLILISFSYLFPKTVNWDPSVFSLILNIYLVALFISGFYNIALLGYATFFVSSNFLYGITAGAPILTALTAMGMVMTIRIENEKLEEDIRKHKEDKE